MLAVLSLLLCKSCFFSSASCSVSRSFSVLCLFCRANQWTGFYMITVSIMKELNLKLTNLSLLQQHVYQHFDGSTVVFLPSNRCFSGLSLSLSPALSPSIYLYLYLSDLNDLMTILRE